MQGLWLFRQNKQGKVAYAEVSRSYIYFASTIVTALFSAAAAAAAEVVACSTRLRSCAAATWLGLR